MAMHQHKETRDVDSFAIEFTSVVLGILHYLSRVWREAVVQNPLNHRNESGGGVRCLLLRWISTLAGIVFALFLSTAQAEFYSWDFLKGDFDNVALTPFGDGAVNLVRPTDKGLRMRLPLGEKTIGIGFATRFQIRGDFEITMRYRIDKLEKPTDGWGAGPSLYLTTVSDLQPASQLSRLSRKDDKEIHAIFQAQPVDGERTKLHKHFDSDAKHGSLRITRVGSNMTWSAANGYSNEFEVLHEAEFDTADVGLARVSLQQSSPETGGTILIEHFSITADELPHLPTSLLQTERIYRPRYTPEPVVPSHPWIWYLIGAVLIGGATGAWLIRRRRG